MRNFFLRANRLGIFLALVLMGCITWYLIYPMQREFHLEFLRSAIIGFQDVNLKSYLFAAIQGYVWGYIFLALWELSGYFTGFSKRK